MLVNLKKSRNFFFTALILLLSNCAGIESNNDPIVKMPNTGGVSVWVPQSVVDEKSAGSIFGDSGIPLFNEQREKGIGTGIGVNVFLWRATLDTTSFLPLLSADPFGGVIITDWYLPIESPNERFKLTIYILDKQLRADGLKISLFKQKRNNNGDWINTEFDKNLVRKLEDTILSRARELKIASIKPK
ncbi:MAG: hypothetical protein CFH01_01468 [Alphaproteobacteria bacterium MarineAlpha2_Bin1]|nr:MAG: hypothetical protein CFH01_01468 [Alphaproteobacteria bacterium MarineAlpha2_Bin1]|tara:strand:+ start:4507 stop:5070 length:564 start_codon:yes stop_codon:yes gene_type:complete